MKCEGSRASATPAVERSATPDLFRIGRRDRRRENPGRSEDAYALGVSGRDASARMQQQIDKSLACHGARHRELSFQVPHSNVLTRRERCGLGANLKKRDKARHFETCLLQVAAEQRFADAPEMPRCGAGETFGSGMEARRHEGGNFAVTTQWQLATSNWLLPCFPARACDIRHFTSEASHFVHFVAFGRQSRLMSSSRWKIISLGRSPASLRKSSS